jgi:hypothetical protein
LQVDGSGEPAGGYLFTPPGVSYDDEPNETRIAGKEPGKGRFGSTTQFAPIPKGAML